VGAGARLPVDKSETVQWSPGDTPRLTHGCASSQSRTDAAHHSSRTDATPCKYKDDEYLAAGEHLETLKWARVNDCPLDEMTCRAAALFGHLERGEVGAGARLSVGYDDVWIHGCGQAPVGAEVGAGAPVPVG
jgi:hypothetical protein